MFDYVAAFKPYINTKIKHYNVPHNFMFSRVNGVVAVMQYKMFSTHQTWLPLMPESMHGIEQLQEHSAGARNVACGGWHRNT